MSRVTMNWPPPCLRVGVIGHRSLLPVQIARVQSGLNAALGVCSKAGYQQRIVCGLAAGADRLAVDWALEHQVELLALLPSDAMSFRNCSSVEDAEAFDRQLQAIGERAHCHLLELPGEIQRGNPGSEEEAGYSLTRIAAHRHKTSVLLRQCEFLIAAMNLADPGKPGGTRECVEEALALGTPVLVIDVDRLAPALDDLRAGTPWES